MRGARNEVTGKGVNRETEYEREARLADMRIRAQDRVNNETAYEREARLAAR